MTSAAIEPLQGTDLPSVSSGRVTLRRFTRADVDRRAEWPRYAEAVFDHLNLDLKTPAQRDAWYRREWTYRHPFWYAVTDEDGELVGIITLREINRWRKSSRLGIHMHPQRLGRGYGTEAMRLFLHYYFDLLGWKALKLDVAAYNYRGIRCYQKVGFRFVHEFWRANLSPVRWLEDPRFADVRRYVVESGSGEEVKHWEMIVEASDYRVLKDRQTTSDE